MPIEFRERKYPALSHAARVFIEGVDVTPWVTGQIDYSLSGRQGNNTLSFQLNNPANAFVLTEANQRGTWRTAGGFGIYGESAKKAIFDNKNKNNPIEKLTGQRRYPFAPYRSVFHRNDRVRCWVKDPYSEGWFCAFSGFLTSGPFDQENISGRSTINITCSDIRTLMSRMRIQTNMVDGIVKPEPLFDGTAGIFQDLVLARHMTHVLGGYSFLACMDFLLLGGSGAGGLGVGRLEGGFIFEADPVDENTIRVERKRFHPSQSQAESIGPASLETWCDLLHYGQDESPITLDEVMRRGAETKSNGAYDTLHGRVHFLLPKSGTGFSELIEYGVNNFLATERSFVTRDALINEITEKIGYECWVTGSGDFVFEFPQIDFSPSMYGSYGNTHTFGKYHLLTANIDEESGEIPTALTATGGFIFQDDPRSGIDVTNFPRAWVTAPVLASRVGVQVDTISFPFTADVKQLCLLTLVEFFRRLSRANRVGASMIYRVGVLPNKAVWLPSVDRMATVQSVSWTLDLNGESEPSFSAALAYPRTKDKDGEYRFITGGRGGPISYRAWGGIGQLFVASDAALVSECTTFGDSHTQISPNRSDASGNFVLESRVNNALADVSLGRGLTRADINDRARTLGVDPDDLVLAYMVLSENSLRDADEADVLIKTALNRVGHPAMGKPAGIFEAITGKSGSTGRQDGGYRPYSTRETPRSGVLLDRALEQVRRSREDYDTGNTLNNAVSFLHPQRGRFNEEVHRKRIERGYTQVIPKGVPPSKVRVYAFPRD